MSNKRTSHDLSKKDDGHSGGDLDPFERIDVVLMSLARLLGQTEARSAQLDVHEPSSPDSKPEEADENADS